MNGPSRSQARRPPRVSEDVVDALSDLLGLRLASLLEALGVGVRKVGKALAGPCPVHGGDNPLAFNVYPEGDRVPGLWKCRSRGCHLHFRSTPLGLAWGVLSRQRHGWSRPGDAKVPFAELLPLAAAAVGSTLDDARVDAAEAEKKRFAAQVATLGYAPERAAEGWPVEAVRARLRVPAGYYLGRGYRPETLERYDVGVWLAGPEPSPMAGRIAVPVFDEGHRRVVGVTGRSPHPACPACRQHHRPGAACPEGRTREAAKWFANNGFAAERHLYNYWFARGEIARTGVAVLVEGPGDVWRLACGTPSPCSGTPSPTASRSSWNGRGPRRWSCSPTATRPAWPANGRSRRPWAGSSGSAR
jgi:hypothetical protein